MKTYTATHEKRPTKLAGLLTKLNAFQQTPVWVKTRRFFWAVGIVLMDVFSALLSGAASATNTANVEDDPDEIDHKDPRTGMWKNSHGVVVCKNCNDDRLSG